MFIFIKIANTILIILSIILISILSAFSITLYSGINLIENKSSIKEIVQTDEIRDSYKQYILISQTDTDISINDGELNSISDLELDKSISLTIDSIYDWLEGEAETPSIIIEKKTETDGLIREEHLEDKIGILAQFVDYEKINNELEEQVPILEFDSSLSEVLPNTYNKLEKWFQYSVGAIFVISLLLVFAGKTVRSGIFFLGIAYTLGALLIIFGPSYLVVSLEQIKSFNLGVSQLPQIEDPSGFLQSISIEIFREILERSRTYAYILLGSGITLIVLSQIGIRRRDVLIEDDVNEKEYDGPEIIIA
jgi:hypothetical protein